jgi:hypothetical protein
LIEELKVELDQLLTRNLPNPTEEDEDSKEDGAPDLGQTKNVLIFDRKGIQTDLFAIERYVDEILAEVMSNREDFLRAINEPIHVDQYKILYNLQNS